jgi:DNA polymerase
MSSAARRAIFLNEIGVGPLWTRRDAPAAAVLAASPAAGLHVAPAAELLVPYITEPANDIASMDWTRLKAVVADCVKCGLCQNRTRTVFGVGDQKANWLFIGEGPGYNEDLQGEPFVGDAGKLLDNMLLAMGLKRGENAYIANVVKCRSTDADGRDRPPSPEEVAACLPYLQRQIELIQPTIIVALGKAAALSLLNLDPDTQVSTLRGTVHRYRELPLVVTYHPAYLLRNLADKKKAWADLRLAMATYAGS